VILFEQPVNGANVAALDRFARKVQRLLALSADISILISDDRRIRGLNRTFRKKDKATDVLSFPRQEGSGRPGGDIAISVEIAAKSASEYGHTLAEELKVLILHGMLHLAGHDHERDNGEMAIREGTLRRQLGLPTTLIERTRAPKASPQRSRKKAKAISREFTVN
jgi:probable rRNA maturation factor